MHAVASNKDVAKDGCSKHMSKRVKEYLLHNALAGMIIGNDHRELIERGLARQSLCDPFK